MKRTLFVLTASLGLAVAAPATMLTLNCTGTFGPMTTLGGTVFGADTPFSYHATFDSTTDVYGNPDQGVFPITSSRQGRRGRGFHAYALEPRRNERIVALALGGNSHLSPPAR